MSLKLLLKDPLSKGNKRIQMDLLIPPMVLGVIRDTNGECIVGSGRFILEHFPKCYEDAALKCHNQRGVSLVNLGEILLNLMNIIIKDIQILF